MSCQTQRTCSEDKSMEIIKKISSMNSSVGTEGRIKYIVIHYVGALGGALANVNYYGSGYRGASAHYFVGHSGEVYQLVEDKDVAWHCGAKTYKHPECRNANSIGIEMCVRNKGSQDDQSRDWYFEDETVNSTIELVRYLMAKYGIDADHVIRHYDVTGKICPNPYVYNHTKHTWNDFKLRISEGTKEDLTPGWKRDDKGWKFVRDDGTLAKDCWELVNHHWYLFGSDGYMLTGFQKWKDEYYYLQESGEFEGACWHEADSGNGSLELWYI